MASPVLGWGAKQMFMRHVAQLLARRFAYEHYRAGHRYSATPSQISCECGESFTGSTL